MDTGPLDSGYFTGHEFRYLNTLAQHQTRTKTSAIEMTTLPGYASGSFILKLFFKLHKLQGVIPIYLHRKKKHRIHHLFRSSRLSPTSGYRYILHECASLEREKCLLINCFVEPCFSQGYSLPFDWLYALQLVHRF